MTANVLAGFRSSGIIPLDSIQVLNKIIPRQNNIAFRNNALTESFKNIMENVTTNENISKPKRRKKINVPAGKSISSNDLSNHPLENDEELDKYPLQNTEQSTSYADLLESQDSESDEDTSEQNSDNVNFKTAVTDCIILKQNMFIVVSFMYMYNEGTKQQKNKEFVVKILNVQDNKTHIIRLNRSNFY